MGSSEDSKDLKKKKKQVQKKKKRKKVEDISLLQHICAFGLLCLVGLVAWLNSVLNRWVTLKNLRQWCCQISNRINQCFQYCLHQFIYIFIIDRKVKGDTEKYSLFCQCRYDKNFRRANQYQLRSWISSEFLSRWKSNIDFHQFLCGEVSRLHNCYLTLWIKGKCFILWMCYAQLEVKCNDLLYSQKSKCSVWAGKPSNHIFGTRRYF